MKTVTFDSTITFDSPIGPITLKALGDAIVKVDLHGFNTGADSRTHDDGMTALTQATPVPAEATPVLAEARNQLTEFFAGKRKNLNFKVSLNGTEFQRAVWGEIAKLGFGKAITYAEIARRIGNPSAVRAVGGAVGSNPVALVVGCHRILGSGERITGYSGGDGLPTKRWLLAHEGITFRDVAEVRRDAETPLKLE